MVDVSKAAKILGVDKENLTYEVMVDALRGIYGEEDFDAFMCESEDPTVAVPLNFSDISKSHPHHIINHFKQTGLIASVDTSAVVNEPARVEVSESAPKPEIESPQDGTILDGVEEPASNDVTVDEVAERFRNARSDAERMAIMNEEEGVSPEDSILANSARTSETRMSQKELARRLDEYNKSIANTEETFGDKVRSKISSGVESLSLFKGAVIVAGGSAVAQVKNAVGSKLFSKEGGVTAKDAEITGSVSSSSDSGIVPDIRPVVTSQEVKKNFSVSESINSFKEGVKSICKPSEFSGESMVYKYIVDSARPSDAYKNKYNEVKGGIDALRSGLNGYVSPQQRVENSLSQLEGDIKAAHSTLYSGETTVVIDEAISRLAQMKQRLSLTDELSDKSKEVATINDQVSKMEQGLDTLEMSMPNGDLSKSHEDGHSLAAE